MLDCLSASLCRRWAVVRAVAMGRDCIGSNYEWIRSKKFLAKNLDTRLRGPSLPTASNRTPHFGFASRLAKKESLALPPLRALACIPASKLSGLVALHVITSLEIHMFYRKTPQDIAFEARLRALELPGERMYRRVMAVLAFSLVICALFV